VISPLKLEGSFTMGYIMDAGMESTGKTLLEEGPSVIKIKR